MLNLDPKDDENFIPEPGFVLFLIPDSIKNTGDPNPKRCDSRFQDLKDVRADLEPPGPYPLADLDPPPPQNIPFS